MMDVMIAPVAPKNVPLKPKYMPDPLLGANNPPKYPPRMGGTIKNRKASNLLKSKEKDNRTSKAISTKRRITKLIQAGPITKGSKNAKNLLSRAIKSPSGHTILIITNHLSSFVEIYANL